MPAKMNTAPVQPNEEQMMHIRYAIEAVCVLSLSRCLQSNEVKHLMEILTVTLHVQYSKQTKSDSSADPQMKKSGRIPDNDGFTVVLNAALHLLIQDC